jgi:hypothetical protein
MDWITTITPLATLTLIALLFSAIDTWNKMKRLRSPRTDPAALLIWQDNVGLDLHKEGTITAILMANDMLRVLVAALCFAVAIRGWYTPPSWVDWLRWPIYYGSIGLALAICWFVAGASIVFWFANYKIRPVVSIFTNEGIYRGQLLVHWQQVSHHQADPQTRSISLYSKKCPQFAMMVCRFPEQEIFEQGRKLVAARLPSAPPHGSDPWYRRKVVFAILLLLTMLPFFLIGLVIYPDNAPWVWGYYAVALFITNYLGATIIRAYS